MKNCAISINLAYTSILTIIFMSFIACSEEQVVPVSTSLVTNHQLNFRSLDPTDRSETVKVNVAKRDNIPLIEILTCSYYGQTLNGYWEYKLTTLNNGNKTFILTGIIGDENEGY